MPGRPCLGDNRGVRTSRHAWWLAGVVAGAAGLATSYFVAMVMTIRESPVVAVAEMVIRLTPGPVVERAISILGTNDKPFLVVVLLVVLALLFAWAGRLARRSWWQPVTLLAAIAVLAGFAISAQRGARATDLLPVVVGFVTWVLCLSILTESLRSDDRQAERRAEAAGAADQDDVGGRPGGAS